MYKLEALIEECKMYENIVWVLKTIQDSLSMNILASGAITVDGIKTATVSLALLKQSLLHELLYPYLDSKPFTSEARLVIRAKLADHGAARANISTPYVQIVDVDMSCGATQADSTMHIVQVIENMIYGDNNDNALKMPSRPAKVLTLL